MRTASFVSSPAATFETDEDRLSFLVRIPCHVGEEGFPETLLAETSNGKEISKEIDNNDKETNKATNQVTQLLINIIIGPNIFNHWSMPTFLGLRIRIRPLLRIRNM